MYILKLLQNNVDIFGFDISEQMIRKLHIKANELGIASNEIANRVTCQNMTMFSYPNKFDLIFIPARSFLHLTSQEDQINCLLQIKKHLSSNGKLMLNFFQPDIELLLARSKLQPEWKLFEKYDFSDGSSSISLFQKQIIDVANQTMHIDFKFVEDNHEYEDKMTVRWIYKTEFQLLLRLAGFSNWKVYGKFDKSPFTNTSSEMIWEINN